MYFVYANKKRTDFLRQSRRMLIYFTRNEYGKAVIYGNAIPVSNFKSLFKSMVSNQQNLNLVGIDTFVCALRSLGVKKNDINGDALKNKD